MYCCTPKALHMGGGSLLNHHQCTASTWMMRRLPVRSPHTSYRWRGERVIEPIKCMRSPHTSYRWRGERVIESIKCMRSPHTSYRWRGERVIESIKCMCSPHTIDKGQWWEFGQDTGVAPLLFTRSAMGF